MESEFQAGAWKRAVSVAKCRDCISSYQRGWYERGGNSKMASARQRRMKVVNSIKEARGCRDCGESHPACLDFHHSDPMEKTISIGVLTARSTPIEKLLAEIEKCEVLCSNCHRKHHWLQKRPRKPKKTAAPVEAPMLRLA